MSSNLREMTATLLSLKSFCSHLQGKAVLGHTDNLSNMANILKGGGTSIPLTRTAKEVWQFCEQHHIQLGMTYVQGLQNTRADALSRVRRDHSDWMLNPQLFALLAHWWGQPQVDLFATRNNCQVPHYFSRFPDPGSAGVDAFEQRWGTYRLAYANPPFQIVGAVLRKVLEEQADLVIVLPEWRTAAWWPNLLELLCDFPVQLPQEDDTFLPGQLGSAQAVGKPPWGVIACRISGRAGPRRVFHQKLRVSRNSGSGSPQTSTDGELGLSSARIAEALTSIPWTALRDSWHHGPHVLRATAT